MRATITDQSGFTLIELLIVTGMIGILLRPASFPISHIRNAPTTLTPKQIFRAFSSPANFIGMIKGRPPTAMSVLYPGLLMVSHLLQKLPFPGREQNPISAGRQFTTPAPPHMR